MFITFTILELIKENTEMHASDLHLTVGVPPVSRVFGHLKYHGDKPLTPEDTERMIREITTPEQFLQLEEEGELDFSISAAGKFRFRVNAFRQRGTYAAALRAVDSKILTLEELGLPETLYELCDKTRGLVLVTGPTGSGKSTTLASMIDYINKKRDCHIITLEDPIEFLHRHKRSIVNQREIGSDTKSYNKALRAALREDPDVILIGEMRDLDSIAIALTAAETGHLVFSTLHTIGAAKTIDRIIDVFPPHQQQQIRVQLSMTLEGVVSQQLIPRKDKEGRRVAVEIMLANPAIRNLIREGKTPQIQNVILTNAKAGMRTMDSSLAELYKNGFISRDNAFFYCVDEEFLKTIIGYTN